MKVVAFLQNMWVRDPERVKRMLADGMAQHGVKYRHRLTATLLFAGCLTGRRLRRELGDLCDAIVWEEASHEVLGNSRDVPKPDLEHIEKVIVTEQPELVITFGQMAKQALIALRAGRPLPPFVCWHSPHPAARDPLSQADFRKLMGSVRSLMTERKAA